MRFTNRRIKTSDFLFFLGWTIYLVSYTMLKLSEINIMFDESFMYKATCLIAGIIFFIKIVFVDKHNIKKILLYLLLIAIFLLNAYYSKSESLLFVLLVILSSNNIDFNKFVKYDMKIRIIMFLFIFMLFSIDLLPNFTRYINGSFKQSFGFAHPNILCIYVVTILLENLYLNKKISVGFVFGNIITLVLLYIYCNSRTSIYTYILIFIIYIFVKNKDKIFNNRIVKLCLCSLPIILFMISFLCIDLYGKNNQFVKELNKVLTTRISSGYRFYNNYGISMFGTKIKTVSTRTALLNNTSIDTLDMGYVRIAINNGLIISLIVIVLFVVMQKRAIEIKDYKFLLICTFFVITGFAENNFTNIVFNFSLASIFYILDYNNKNKLVNK